MGKRLSAIEKAMVGAVACAIEDKKQERIALGLCPECADVLHSIEGCRKCISCGRSACN